MTALAAELSGRVCFRRGEPTDAAFVLDSWLRSYRKAPLVAQLIPQVYFVGERRRAVDALARSTVFIACDPREPTEVWGYAVVREVGDAQLIEYVYVKQAFRRLGIATALLEKALLPGPVFHAREAPRAAMLLAKFNSKFHPYLGVSR